MSSAPSSAHRAVYTARLRLICYVRLIGLAGGPICLRALGAGSCARGHAGAGEVLLKRRVR